MWAGLLPSGTILFANSFFGSHELARDVAAERHAFLMMTKRSTYGVDTAGELLSEGQTATCTVDDARYAMVVCKNPKMGHKLPRVVPMLMNVHFPQAGPVHRRSGSEVNPTVSSYRQLSRGVDGVSQMALQMRQMKRQKMWPQAMRAFVLRYAVVNTYASCRSLGGARTGTMIDWQWDLIRRCFCTVAEAKPIHLPARMPGRRVCTHCNRGKTHYVCCGCGNWYHVGCFAVAHGMTGVVEADVGEESDEAEEDGSKREEIEDDTEEESDRVRRRETRMRRKRVSRRRRVTVKRTRTGKMTKIRKEKVVEGGRGGIVNFMAAKPLLSLPMGPVRTLRDNRVGWMAKL